MYLTHVRHTIQDYARWRASFDANAHMLEENGCLATHIVQVNGSPSDIAVINLWPAAKNWDEFIAAHHFKSPEEAKQKQAEAGVIGEPVFWGGEVM